MNPSRPFILRPIATSLLMAAILLAGAVAYRQLPVSALPQVDYPTIQVLTFYPGASPSVMASSVTTPLERQFGQVPGLNQMTSTSSFGASLITLQFVLDLNIDVAEQQVQAAINAATTYLPANLPNPPIYSKTNPADTPVLTLALTSDTLPLTKLEDMADTVLSQKIAQLPGVGLVSISGGEKPSVRIQANPTALASYGLSLEDLRTALGQANVNQAKGNLDSSQQAFTIWANDQLMTADSYKPIVIAYKNGGPVRIMDVANVIDGAENVKLAAWENDKPAVIVNIQRQPGANIINVVDRIKNLLPQLKASLPSSVQLSTLTDRTTTIRASVSDVQFELMLTVALVVLVIFLFLRSPSATAIPSVAVPLSLVGTFGVMYLLGYSLDNLSLMALTISTGFVVDDAIVMIENIARYIEEGDPPLEAALKGSEQIGFTILSLTVSLIAVLIPLLFMQDVVGRLFREFAITSERDDSGFGRRVADAHSDDVLENFAPPKRIGKELVLQGFGTFAELDHRSIRGDPAICAQASAGHAGRDGRNPGAYDLSVPGHPQRLFPRAGYRSPPGHLGSPGNHFVSGHGGTPAGSRESYFEGSRCGQPLVVHRRRRRQHAAEQRAHSDQPEIARGKNG